MATNPPTWQTPKPERSAIQWLLDGSDPSIRWQVMQGLTDASDEEIAAERAKIATDGWGATLLAAQSEDGTWPADPRFPEWPTLRTLLLLHDMGLDPANEQAQRAVGRVRENVKWLMNITQDELPKDEDISWWHKPFFAGEVEPCINGRVVTVGAYVGMDMRPLVDRLLGEQMTDGGWNCDQDIGSTRGSFHTTINVLEGLLEFEHATGGSAAVRQHASAGRSTCSHAISSSSYRPANPSSMTAKVALSGRNSLTPPAGTTTFCAGCCICAMPGWHQTRAWPKPSRSLPPSAIRTVAGRWG